MNSWRNAFAQAARATRDVLVDVFESQASKDHKRDINYMLWTAVSTLNQYKLVETIIAEHANKIGADMARSCLSCAARKADTRMIDLLITGFDAYYDDDVMSSAMVVGATGRDPMATIDYFYNYHAGRMNADAGGTALTHAALEGYSGLLPRIFEYWGADITAEHIEEAKHMAETRSLYHGHEGHEICIAFLDKKLAAISSMNALKPRP